MELLTISGGVSEARAPALRPQARGKFIFVGEEKFCIRGVTYGPFRPGADGCEYHDLESVEQDFAQMATCGINAVRTYTVPPRWLLDCARRHGLRVMVGLPWEQHVAFLHDRQLARAIETRIAEGVAACAGHPAVLCYSIGQEIPASIVRWHGHRRIERYLRRLYDIAKAGDPEALVAYVNYPSTEYLHLPFVDLICFNVYLESPEAYSAYLARLQNIVGDRPLVLTEIGLDSRRNGEDVQAAALDWQIRRAFCGGAAGVFTFAWTDEWHRGGADIDDWDFGLTTRDRQHKPALAAVQQAFAESPVRPAPGWPHISVVVCTYNGAPVIRDCLDGLQKIQYPNFDVTVVNDGSNDRTTEIVREYGFRLITTKNSGLSAARNVGMEAAQGEIVAYIDDDVRPDPQWLTYLAASFRNTQHAGIGGPNVPPPGDGLIADCVAQSPGGPIHVLLSDQEAEHIPGCNMAFRKTALQAIGGFDPQFRVAGDDVDVCWRMQKAGYTLGFSPAAMVWHHRRNTIRAYWKQQLGYGRAEALLERKWPEKYNSVGHPNWAGRLYGNGLVSLPGWRRTNRIYQGTWGSALFQSVYERTPNTWLSLPLMPEWYLLVFTLVVLTTSVEKLRPFRWLEGVLIVAIGIPILQALFTVFTTCLRGRRLPYVGRVTASALTVLLHMVQPLARLCGRLQYGLTPWRTRCGRGFSMPWVRMRTAWSEQWRSPNQWLSAVETSLRNDGASAIRGGSFDNWDLEVRGGALGGVRLRMGIEEHGLGRQLVRFRIWPVARHCGAGLLMSLFFAFPCIKTLVHGYWHRSAMFGTISLLLALQTLRECGTAMAAALHAVTEPKPSQAELPLREPAVACASSGNGNGSRAQSPATVITSRLSPAGVPAPQTVLSADS